MLRECTGMIGLKEMGRSGASFDMNKESIFKIQAGGHQLEVASGYITSIRRYESNVILMNVYALHKVFRKETVAHVMARVMKSLPKAQHGEFRDKVRPCSCF